ncbi:c-type cytochrome [Nitrincola schmidtii]|uniref:c-type cytochrome n=1 Tax=Nitrincola schmidtii TaxID=1730894 RepID=UPI00124C1331|nr:c-type cytochrome [Nitrincola schmidtii]
MKILSHIPLISACITLGFAVQANAIDGDATRGQAAAAVCTACHQADGSGMYMPGGESWPRLAGLDAAYIYKQLKDFTEGQRKNASMAPFAAMLNDQQMRDVSVYYSEMPATAGKGGESADEEMLKWGQTLATNGDWSRYIPSCQSCHGPDNLGAGEHFPAIAGQHSGYIEAQLLAWQKETRQNDPQHLMLAIAERLSPYDIQAVSAWLSMQPSQ